MIWRLLEHTVKFFALVIGLRNLFFLAITSFIFVQLLFNLAENTFSDFNLLTLL